MRSTGPETTPRDRDELGITEWQREHGHAAVRLVERVAELEHVAPPELPPAPPAAPAGQRSPWVAGIAILAALAGGALLGHSITTNNATAPTGSATAQTGHDHGVANPLATPQFHPQKRGRVEVYHRPDPLLPKVPVGPVKRFRIDVDQHLTRVAPGGKSFEVWSFGVNGQFFSGTGGSPPMVVNQGDTVEVTFYNGFSHAMNVTLPHSLDLHAAAADPTTEFPTIAPGKTHTIRFTADHPGVFMYHCVSTPALLHVGAGMAGMFVVKPKNLPKVDRELWITQQEFYAPAQGAAPDYQRMLDNKPTTIAFNGYADQYIDHPIRIKKGEKIRMYVLNAGAQRWSAFHVIGAVFDETYIEGVVGHDAQTVSLAPSQGGWMDITINQEGSYPFVSHAFGDVELGATGALRTTHAHGPVMEH